MITYIESLILKAPNQLISYADYMNAALYHPDHGYYMKERQKIGREGDFITTSNISDIYGKLAAKWFANICIKTQFPPRFCEIGAGNGRFAYSFLKSWEESVQLPIQYIIIETSPYHRKIQGELLQSFPGVIQLDGLKRLEQFDGMVFSNELFDAFPVHVIEKSNGDLAEVMIGMEGGKLFEKRVPLRNPEILRFLKEADISLTEQQRIEIPLAMEKMIGEIAKTLEKGLVVTADYGYTREEWMDTVRADGSMRGFYQHQMKNNVLELPGEMDITTHIHFDSLIEKGMQAGLRLLTKLRQDEFLLKAGILMELENHYDPNPFSEVSKRNRAIRSLIMPGGMSSYFHVVIQQKGISLRVEELFKE